MNKCPECSTRFKSTDFFCPDCKYTPISINGIPAFAPDRIVDGKGFNKENFQELYKAEPASFWFNSRNKLICLVMKRFFPKINKMLEIGCGTGFVLQAVHQQNPDTQLFGSDFFPQGLFFAQQRLKSAVKLWQMDAREIPFVNEFDVIGAFDVIEHIKEDDKVLAQMHHALVPQGRVFITVPQHKWMWSNLDDEAMHQRRYKAKELKEKLNNAGFVLEYSTSFVSLLLPVMFFSRFIRKKSKQMAKSQLYIHPAINLLLGFVMDIELIMIKMGVKLPFGGSFLIVARAD